MFKFEPEVYDTQFDIEFFIGDLLRLMIWFIPKFCVIWGWTKVLVWGYFINVFLFTYSGHITKFLCHFNIEFYLFNLDWSYLFSVLYLFLSNWKYIYIYIWSISKWMKVWELICILIKVECQNRSNLTWRIKMKGRMEKKA